MTENIENVATINAPTDGQKTQIKFEITKINIIEQLSYEEIIKKLSYEEILAIINSGEIIGEKSGVTNCEKKNFLKKQLRFYFSNELKEAEIQNIQKKITSILQDHVNLNNSVEEFTGEIMEFNGKLGNITEKLKGFNKKLTSIRTNCSLPIEDLTPLNNKLNDIKKKAEILGIEKEQISDIEQIIKDLDTNNKLNDIKKKAQISDIEKTQISDIEQITKDLDIEGMIKDLNAEQIIKDSDNVNKKTDQFNSKLKEFKVKYNFTDNDGDLLNKILPNIDKEKICRALFASLRNKITVIDFDNKYIIFPSKSDGVQFVFTQGENKDSIYLYTNSSEKSQDQYEKSYGKISNITNIKKETENECIGFNRIKISKLEKMLNDPKSKTDDIYEFIGKIVAVNLSFEKKEIEKDGEKLQISSKTNYDAKARKITDIFTRHDPASSYIILKNTLTTTGGAKENVYKNYEIKNKELIIEPKELIIEPIVDFFK